MATRARVTYGQKEHRFRAWTQEEIRAGVDYSPLKQVLCFKVLASSLPTPNILQGGPCPSIQEHEITPNPEYSPGGPCPSIQEHAVHADL